MPAFWKNPVNEQGYVMFLSRQGAAGTLFKPTGGPQGLFLISPWDGGEAGELSLKAEQTIVPQVRPSDKLMMSYEGTSAVNFIGELRRAIAPESGAGR